jgi:hypothetical protein
VEEKTVDVENLVRWPGACLAAAGLLQIFTSIGSLAISAWVDVDEVVRQYLESVAPGSSSDVDFGGSLDWSSPLNLALNTVFFVLHGLIVWGGVSMMMQRRWGLSMAAAVLAIFPCTSPCCCLGLPLGIWAVVVLTRPEVKAAMRSARPS